VIPVRSVEFSLAGHRLDVLELILEGLLAPIDGYCLPGARPAGWPFDATLSVPDVLLPEELHSGSIVLTDPDGTPLARLNLSETSPGPDGFTNVAGRIVRLSAAEHPPERQIRLSATDGESQVMAVFASVPDAAGMALAVSRADGRPLTFLTVSWGTRRDDRSVLRLVDELRRCSANVPGSSVRFVAIASPAADVEERSVLARVLDVVSPIDILDFSRERSDTPAPKAESGLGGTVVLLTGFSGSGKSTIARALAERLHRDGLARAVLLDGDDVRRALSPDLGFTMPEREVNMRRIGWVAAKIASVGAIAICAPIAPFAKTRAEIRVLAEAEGRFLLVHVSTPLAVCEKRDRKGLYARARAGQVKDFTGIDSPYETPTDADVAIDTSLVGTAEAVNRIISCLWLSE
jgi:sulfate adenylyltransferase